MTPNEGLTWKESLKQPSFYIIAFCNNLSSVSLIVFINCYKVNNKLIERIQIPDKYKN